MQHGNPMPDSVINETFVSAVVGDRGGRGAARPPGEAMHLSAFTDYMERMRESDCAAAWRMGERLDFRSLGALGEAMAEAPALGAAVRTFSCNFALVQSNSALTLTVSDGVARMGYRVLDPAIWPRRADAELTLAFLLALSSHFGFPREAIAHVGLEHRADEATPAISSRLGTDIAYGEAENSIEFPDRLLSLKPRAGASGGRARFDALCAEVGAELARERGRRSVSDRVRRRMLVRIGRAPIAQDDIARGLGMSARSLRRSLAEEGASFQGLREQCVRASGLALLTRSDLPLSQVALSLGYSDQTAFSRAFSHWYGKPPNSIRHDGVRARPS